jgi:hypothetical protein
MNEVEIDEGSELLAALEGSLSRDALRVVRETAQPGPTNARASDRELVWWDIVRPLREGNRSPRLLERARKIVAAERGFRQRMIELGERVERALEGQEPPHELQSGMGSVAWCALVARERHGARRGDWERYADLIARTLEGELVPHAAWVARHRESR